MKLDTKRHYALITAFRGPDCAFSDFALKIKWALTARFRYWVDVDISMADVRRKPLPEAYYQNILDLARAMADKPIWFDHFMTHCDMALQSFHGMHAEFPTVDLDEHNRLRKLVRDLVAIFGEEDDC